MKQAAPELRLKKPAATWSDDHILWQNDHMKERVLSASEFKAKCLACLDDIERFGERITVTRRGRPVAVLAPAPRGAAKSPRNSWARKASIEGDIVSPLNLWEVSASKRER